MHSRVNQCVCHIFSFTWNIQEGYAVGSNFIKYDVRNIYWIFYALLVE